MNGDEIRHILVELGMPIRAKGTEHIVRVAMLMDSGWNDLPLERIYWKIAEEEKISHKCVERRIRLAISSARERGSYIAIAHPQNRSFIIWLYNFLKECEEGDMI